MKRVALIGLGMVADTHRLAMEASGVVELTTVCARRANNAADYAAQHKLNAAPLEAIAADPDIDFVIVATPPNARVDLVATLLQAGKPILMEKPIERSLPAARRIVEQCETAGVPLGIVFQHRFRDVSRKLGEMVLSGALGEIAHVEIAVPWWRDQSYYDEPGRGSIEKDGGGVLITQAIHTLDLTLSLTGPVAQVQAMARTSGLHRMEAEDVVAAGLDFASGAVGTLTASTASFPGGAESITLHGTRGSAQLARAQLDVHWRDGTRETFGALSNTGGGADPMAFTHAWHQGVIEDFAASLDENRPPLVTGREALKTHALIDALIDSSRRGTRVDVADV